MGRSDQTNSGDGFAPVESDVFENPLGQTRPSAGPIVSPRARVFETEEASASTQNDKKAQGTKTLHVNVQSKLEKSEDDAKATGKKEEKQRKRDGKLRQQNKRPGKAARLGEGMKRLLRFPSSLAYMHDLVGKDDPRKADAEVMWKRIFAMLDFKNDHSLTVVELREGLKMIQSRWEELQGLYPCDEVAFAKHQIRGGSQDDPEQDPVSLVAAEGECAPLWQFA
jgi:hypothetical protein